MARLLYIKANPKPCDQSLTYRLSDFFIQAYQQAHPTDEVEVLDLYQTIMPIMDYERLSRYNQGIETEIKQIAEQFKSYDKCVIAAPVWNHSFPAMLKVYLEMKVLYITSSGQVYDGERKFLDHHQSQIKAIFDLIGLTQVEVVGLLGRNRLSNEQLLQEVGKLQGELQQKAQIF